MVGTVIDYANCVSVMRRSVVLRKTGDYTLKDVDLVGISWRVRDLREEIGWMAERDVNKRQVQRAVVFDYKQNSSGFAESVVLRTG